MEKEFELMDWKNMEAGAEQQIRDGRNQVKIGGILLKEAVIQIKKMGGQTNEEIDNAAKKVMDQPAPKGEEHKAILLK